MDRGAWWATVHGVAKSQTQRSDFTFKACKWTEKPARRRAGGREPLLRPESTPRTPPNTARENGGGDLPGNPKQTPPQMGPWAWLGRAHWLSGPKQTQRAPVSMRARVFPPHRPLPSSPALAPPLPLQVPLDHTHPRPPQLWCPPLCRHSQHPHPCPEDFFPVHPGPDNLVNALLPGKKQGHHSQKRFQPSFQPSRATRKE